MKKIFYTVDITLILCTLASLVGYFNFGLEWLKTLFLVLVFFMSGLHLLYVLNFRNRKSILPTCLIILGLVLLVVAKRYIITNPNLFFGLMAAGELFFIAALITTRKFSIWNIVFMLAISIPMLVLINVDALFGYFGNWNRVFVCLFVFMTASLFGLSISHVIKKQNCFNCVFSIVAFFNLILSLGFVILKQSNVTHKINSIINMCFYVLLFLFGLTLLFITHDSSKSTIKTKANVVYSISVLLTVVLFGYTFVSNFLAFNFISAKISKNQFMSMVENNLNIPVVEICTQDNKEPQNKKDYVNCSFEISNCENEEFNFSVPMAENYEDEGCVGIRLRGNSTMRARKRPYRIKFDEKQSFFGLKANKSWVLLADYYDQSYIRNYTALTLADNFDNLDFSPTPHHVALIINKEFKGLYLLCEQMDEKKGRANVDEDFDINQDKEFPFLVEMDINAGVEGVTGVDNFYVESAKNHVEIKYPETDERFATERSDKVYDYIYEYINAVFTTIKTGEKVEVSFRDTAVGLEDLVNIDSAVDYYLINEIMLNTDNPYKSIYLHKTKNGKMEFGPIWDFDFSMTTKLVAPYDKSYSEDSKVLWIAQKSEIYQGLFKNESFYNKVATRYNEKSSAILETCNIMKEYKETIDSVALIDAKMWHGMTGEFQYDMQYDYVRLFLMDRYNYLNTVFAKTHAEFLEMI